MSSAMGSVESWHRGRRKRTRLLRALVMIVTMMMSSSSYPTVAVRGSGSSRSRRLDGLREASSSEIRCERAAEERLYLGQIVRGGEFR